MGADACNSLKQAHSRRPRSGRTAGDKPQPAVAGASPALPVTRLRRGQTLGHLHSRMLGRQLQPLGSKPWGPRLAAPPCRGGTPSDLPFVSISPGGKGLRGERSGPRPRAPATLASRPGGLGTPASALPFEHSGLLPDGAQERLCGFPSEGRSASLSCPKAPSHLESIWHHGHSCPSQPCRSGVGGAGQGAGRAAPVRLPRRDGPLATADDTVRVPLGWAGIPRVMETGGLWSNLWGGDPTPGPWHPGTHMAIANCSIHFLFMSSVLQKNWKPCFPWR